MITFEPYAKFRPLPFGRVYVELGVNMRNDDDPVEQRTAVHFRRVCRDQWEADEYYHDYRGFFSDAEEDEFLGV